MEKLERFNLNITEKFYIKIVMDFVEALQMENKIFAYMRISTNKKTQKVDRQKQTIIEYSISNNFKIDEFVADVICRFPGFGFHCNFVFPFWYAEVISYNKKNLEREIQNESRHQAVQRTANRQQSRAKRREEI